MGIKQLVTVVSLLAAAGLHAADAPAPADPSASPKASPAMSSAAQRAAADSAPGAPAPGTPAAFEAALGTQNPPSGAPPAEAGPQAPLAPMEWRLTVENGRIRTAVNLPGASDAGFDYFRYNDSTMVRYFNAAHDATHEDGSSVLPHGNYRPELPADAVGPSQAYAERQGTGWAISYLNQENRVTVAYAQELAEGVAPPPEPACCPEVVTPLLASVSIVLGPQKTVTFLPWASRPNDYFVVRSLPKAVSMLHVDAQGGLQLQEVVEKAELSQETFNKVKAMIRKGGEPPTPIFAIAIRGFNGWNISYVDGGGQGKTVFAVDAAKPPEAASDGVAAPVEDPDANRRWWLAGISFTLMIVAGMVAWWLYRRQKSGKTGDRRKASRTGWRPWHPITNALRKATG